MNLFTKGLLLIAIPFGFELVLLSFLFQGQQESMHAEYWAVHSREVIKEGDAVLEQVLEESLRFRGELLAARPSLAPDAFWTGLDARVAKLETLVADNPTQAARARVMRETVVQYRAALAETLRIALVGGPDAISRRYAPGGGVVVLDRLREQLANFLTEEARLDRERNQAVVDTRLRQRRLLVAVAVVSLGAALAGAYGFSRSIGTRVATLTTNAERLTQGAPLLAPVGGTDEIARLDRVLHEASQRLLEADQLKQVYQRDLEARALELAEVNASLLKQTEDNELFVYSVSHDLRSPLVNLQGFNRELRRATDEIQSIASGLSGNQDHLARMHSLIAGEMRESLHYMDTAVQRAAAIIDALLRLSRAGRVEYVARPVNVQALVQRVVDALHDTIRSRGVEVRVLPLPAVLGDGAALEQVFGNLIGNAVTYLDPARPGQVEIGALPVATDAGPIVYYVKDNGLGIAPAYLGKVFTAFERLHSAVAAGEGIGLALVRRVVERHGGRVWVESEEGMGSSFFLSLPNLLPPDRDGSGGIRSDAEG